MAPGDTPLHPILDALVRELVTGCDSLDELLGRWTAHRYRPTLRADLPDGERRVLLADVYDLVAALRRIDVKAIRD